MAEDLQPIEKVAGQIWDVVCRNIDSVLKECELYGLAGILEVTDPSVDARLTALRSFESVCASIISALEQSPDHHSTIRIMINSQQQILNLRLLLNAAKNGDSKEFEVMKLKLGEQATH